MNKEGNIEQKQSLFEGVVEELKSVVGDKISFEGRDINGIVRERFKLASEVVEHNTLYEVDFKDGSKLIVSKSRRNADNPFENSFIEKGGDLRSWQTRITEVNPEGTKIKLTQLNEIGEVERVVEEEREKPEAWVNYSRTKDQVEFWREVLDELGGEHTVEEFSA